MKVSIIIPCYNGEKYLMECLHSVSLQKFQNIEPIIVDDGSVDQSSMIIKEWNASEPLKFRLVQTENRGSAHARNTGLSLATGDYVQFLDVDDLLLEEKLSNQINLITKSESLPDIIAGSYRAVSNPETGTGTIHTPYSTDVWTALITSRLGITSSNLFNRKTLDEISGFTTTQKSSQEYELMFRIMKRNFKILFDNEVNTIKRNINPTSISYSNKALNSKRYIQLRADIMNYLIYSETGEKYISECQNEIFREIRKLYALDKASGIEFYKKYVQRHFTPLKTFNASRRKLPAFYKLFYLILGFRFSEHFYSTVAYFKKIAEV